MALAAQSLFEQEEYIKAFPLYSQLLSLDKDNAELSYRFGVCLLYADRSDTYAPINYLKKALDQINDPEIYYHLGFAYHINYYFPAAISFYDQYKGKVGKKAKDSFDVDRKIEMCQNGMKMMRSVKDLFVLKKSEVPRNEFFRSYELQDFGGKMISKPEAFLSKEDLNQEERDFIFFNSKAKSVYYSSYGKGNKKQKDIYLRNKMPDGSWSDAERLSDVINTIYDEDFPVMMPDGKTLYFSSRGHNTIGGYDIFKSIYNQQTKTWSIPENINFPFNTPVDDILFVSDTSESTAWFASVRNSVDNKIMVYEVGIIKRPEGSTDLAAIYAKNQELTEDDLRQIKLRAKLDVNISLDEYEEIPVVKEDPIAAAEKLHQENLAKIEAEVDVKKQQQLVIDSAKSIVVGLEQMMESFDSVRKDAVSLAASKRLESRRIRAEVKNNLQIVAKSNDRSVLEQVIKESNKSIGKAERLDYEAAELDLFAQKTKSEIDKQKETFADINHKYGDVENAVLQNEKEKANNILGQMKFQLMQTPQLLELNKSFEKEEGGLKNIQYPTELENPDTFIAFVISNDASAPQIEPFSERYNELIPVKEQTKDDPSISTYSNNPSTKIQEYIDVLYEKAKSLDVQIAEQEKEIKFTKERFNTLPANLKQDEIKILNDLIHEQNTNTQEASLARELALELQENHQKQVLSAIDSQAKMASYQQMVKNIEELFDFDKKRFITSNPMVMASLSAIPIEYQISNDGKLQQLDLSKQALIPSFQIQYDENHSSEISQQALQMQSRMRTENKKNGFSIQKVELMIQNLENEANSDFNEAQTILATAKTSSNFSKPNLINDANEKFKSAALKTEELNSYKNVLGEMQKAEADSKVILENTSKKADQLQNAISNQDWNQVKNIYAEMEKDYNNHQAIVDFSVELNSETSELKSFSPTIATNDFKAFQLNNNGEIVKTIGDNASDWTNIENFTSDVLSSSSPSNLVLSPNANLQSKQSNIVAIFQPKSSFSEADLKVSNIIIPANFQQSQNSIIKNSVLQINNLKSQTESLIGKRNALQGFYNKTLKEASDLEANSLNILDKEIISPELVQQANKISADSKKSLWKASEASNLIKEYDQLIFSHTELISDALVDIEKMQDFLASGNQDEALLINVQLQRKISQLADNSVDDSKFNYAVNDIFESTPAVFDLPENQEFMIENGQIQRNDQAQLNQFFYENASNIDVNLANSPYIVVNSSTPSITDLQEQKPIEISSNNSPTIAETNSSNNIPSDIKTDIQDKVDIQSYQADQFSTANEIRNALAELNNYAQQHMSKINGTKDALLILAEQKLSLSNAKSIEAESIANPTEKQNKQNESKKYLYEALAVKSIAENYQEFVNEEKSKQENITETSFQIEEKLKINDISSSKNLFEKMQKTVQSFGLEGAEALSAIQSQVILSNAGIKQKMDSAYSKSQDLANESVKLLSDASEERIKAEGKKNAFKRREMLKTAEDLEIKATELQNQSEKALAFGNELYQQSQVALAFENISADITQISSASIVPSNSIVNQALVFEGIDNRKQEVLEGKLNTTTNRTTPKAQMPLAKTDDVHVYERETFKAQMISEELDVLKREIALLVKVDKSKLSAQENYVIDNQIKNLRAKTDSLEYEAQKAFDFANTILESLSADEQKIAKGKGRTFDDYLKDLKDRIEILLSEASSLKQRAERSNNPETREQLYNQAKENEEIAMYLILEEFEVIAQKNATRYRKNQLVLQQMILENASLEERNLMFGIFAQIDAYFDEAKLKRQKANEVGVSFNMRKILLQDAYSLEMKALDLQQQAQVMLTKHDKQSMLAYQKVNNQEELIASGENTIVKPVTSNTQNSIIETQTEANNQNIKKQEIPFENPKEGTIYKVQFSALKELKSADFFNQVAEITAERVPNSDFIRYFSGSFKEIDAAIIRRNSLRTSGYPDAFIKSWNNGESISLLASQQSDNASNNVGAPSTGGTIINNVDFSATNISSLSGVYYTVQIGVYSRPRTSAMIFGIAPLYHKRLNNGYWIYYSGIFKSINEAEKKKEDAISRGVSDAFVVAFSNGQSVDLTEARELISRGGTSPQEDEIVILEDASKQIDSEWNMTQNNSFTSSDSQAPTTYSIQVGVYSNRVDLSWITSQLDTSEQLDISQSTNGKYVYKLGNYLTEESARAQLKAVQELVPDAFVVAFRGGRKIYIQ